MVFIIPILGITAGIIAIIGGIYIKSKKLDLQKIQQNPKELEKLADEIQRLHLENESLKKRIHNIETIATSKEWEALPSALDHEIDTEEKAAILAKKLNR